MLSESPYRSTHSHPLPGTKAYDQGKLQGEINLERLHYLRASILGKFKLLIDVKPDRSRGQLFQRQALDFSSYMEFNLAPVTGIKLHPREDGTLLPADVEHYHHLMQSDYRILEGGVLDAVLRDPRAFFNIMLHYHSKAKTTGNSEWDSYFARLKTNGFPEGDIQCLYFARASGCLNGDCPFLHDELATKNAREMVVEGRRDSMLGPTDKQIMVYTLRRMNDYALAHNIDLYKKLSDDIEDDGPELNEQQFKELDNELTVTRARAFCASPSCGKPWLFSEEKSPLKACGRCKWTSYCSKECQVNDWPRHKKEPCAPVEEIIRNDDLWSPAGLRKGTERYNIL